MSDEHIWVANTHTITTGDEDAKTKTIMSCPIIERDKLAIAFDGEKDCYTIFLSVDIPKQMIKTMAGSVAVLPVIEIDRDCLAPEILVGVDNKYKGAAIKIENGRAKDLFASLPKVVERDDE